MNASQNYHAGQIAEEIVAQKYVAAGFDVISKRYRRREGEIDLVLGHKDKLYFVEVKKSSSFDKAAERINLHQISRIKNAAMRFLVDTGRKLETEMRFDAALVNGVGQVKVIANAF
ncbi:hypothetical protein BFP76_01445 [Amylibacter kogurei]|uniref:UPF0102 protein BFP76_01445 n=1 Tax=Paramylibacter kogurei TaxID=1889778 RepID=A0A2G5K342_9RHOB|nr:YraN family protein [Amylibacter kogurei]PIB23946.1 hypothetical protein BFP76_01445 [Amylibacter kogurei]